MDDQAGAKEDIDLSHDVISKKSNEPHEDMPTTTHTELNENEESKQDQELATAEIKLRKKSMRRSNSPGNLSNKDDCHVEQDNASSTQMDKEKELNRGGEEKVEETMTEFMPDNEKPKSTIQQIGLFLVLFFGLVVVNQTVIKMILYIFKPDSVNDVHGKGLEVDSSKYDEEQEFSEFDRLMEH